MLWPLKEITRPKPQTRGRRERHNQQTPTGNQLMAYSYNFGTFSMSSKPSSLRVLRGAMISKAHPFLGEEWIQDTYAISQRCSRIILDNTRTTRCIALVDGQWNWESHQDSGHNPTPQVAIRRQSTDGHLHITWLAIHRMSDNGRWLCWSVHYYRLPWKSYCNVDSKTEVFGVIPTKKLLGLLAYIGQSKRRLATSGFLPIRDLDTSQLVEFLIRQEMLDRSPINETLIFPGYPPLYRVRSKKGCQHQGRMVSPSNDDHSHRICSSVRDNPWYITP